MPDPDPPPPPPVEGRDYHVEAGRWVFTAYFLRNRGYCCRSGCRHCPYGTRKEEGKAEGSDEAGGR